MTKISAILEILVGVYCIYIAMNMMRFTGRQKKQILAAIPEESKAVQYGKEAGRLMLVTAVGIIAIGAAWLATENRFVSYIDEAFILVCLIVLLQINKKWTGKYGVTIW